MDEQRRCPCGNKAVDSQTGKCDDCRTDEMTMAELDALVASQMRNLPPWWNNSIVKDTLPRGRESQKRKRKK